MSTTEEQVISQAEPQTPVAPVAAPPVPAEPAAPAQPLTRRDQLSEAFKKPPTERGRHAQFQPREEKGKFVPGAPVVPVTPVTRPPLLAALKKEIEPHWNAAPVELLQEIVRREEDHVKGVEPLKARAKQADELLEEFKPYEAMLSAEGGTPRTAIKTLLQTAAMIRQGTPLQKAQLIAQAMQQFGIPLAHLQQIFGSPQGAPPSTPQVALDPHYNALSQELNTIKQALNTRQQQEQQQKESQALTTIETFAKDPAHPHFEAVQEKMLGLLEAPGVIKNVLGIDISGMDYAGRLKVAYDTAIRLDPALSAQLAATPQVPQQQSSHVQKSKAVAGLQVKGAPGSGPAAAIDPNDRRALIASAMKRQR